MLAREDAHFVTLDKLLQADRAFGHVVGQNSVWPQGDSWEAIRIEPPHFNLCGTSPLGGIVSSPRDPPAVLEEAETEAEDHHWYHDSQRKGHC